MIKKIAKIIAIISVVLLVGSVILHKKCGDEILPKYAKNAHLLQPKTYRPPAIKIPFITKDEAPVRKKDLPIPRKDVAKTIEITQLGGKKVTIIIDKKGKIYKSTDTPDDAKIEVTHWKPALFGFQNKWGVGVTMDIPPDLSFTLSWDTIRIWKLHFGLDLGVKLEDQGMTDAWLGTSVKYKILKNNNLFALAGYNWVDKTPYVGVMLRF